MGWLCKSQGVLPRENTFLRMCKSAKPWEEEKNSRWTLVNADGRKAANKKNDRIYRISRINSIRHYPVDPVNPVKKLALATQTFTFSNTDINTTKKYLRLSASIGG